MLFSSKRKLTTDKSNKLDGSQKYKVEPKKSDTKKTEVGLHLCEVQGLAKQIYGDKNRSNCCLCGGKAVAWKRAWGNL